jgi:serine/threonine-protein kinase
MYNYTAWHDAYRRRDYRRALELALKLDTPDNFYQHAVLAMCYAQLGETDAAHKSLQDMLAIKPDYGQVARQLHGKWIQPDLVEQLMDGLRKAGLEIAPGDERTVASPVVAPASSASTPSIAVLPFANLSADPDQEYFSDGLAEEIINALTRLPGVRVIARTSAFRFRGEQDLRKVGEVLGVRTVLEGSVRKAGQRLRITAQLIDVTDQSQVWSERFDRELVDVFEIQDEISHAIAARLHLTLGAGAQAKRPTVNVKAYEALLEGRHFFSQFTPQGAERALACARRALAIEPDYPDALALYAFYHVMSAYMFVDPREALPQAKALAERALALDPQHVEAQAIIGLITVWLDRRWSAAEDFFRRALAQAPSSGRAHELYGLSCLLGTGRLAESLAALDRAIELDPLSALYAGNRGRVLTCSRRFGDAEASCRRGLALDPGQLLVQVELVYALTFQQKLKEAEAIGRRALRAHGRVNAPTHALALSLALAGERDEAFQLLDGPVGPGAGPYQSPLTRGLVHAAFAEMDPAFECVERAMDERDPLLMYLTVHPMFDTLRPDPRYVALVKRMNL